MGRGDIDFDAVLESKSFRGPVFVESFLVVVAMKVLCAAAKE